MGYVKLILSCVVVVVEDVIEFVFLNLFFLVFYMILEILRLVREDGCLVVVVVLEFESVFEDKEFIKKLKMVVLVYCKFVFVYVVVF